MAIPSWPFKDPDELLDYVIDWSARLDTDTIATSTWEINGPDAVLTTPSDSFASDKTTIWLDAGTLGAVYTMTNHITTAGSREMDQSVKLRIKTK